jgi:hypothetical protein
MNLFVECVDVDYDYNEYEQNRLIGVKDNQGAGRKMTQEDAIDFIQKGGSIFCNPPVGRAACQLVVATSPNGKKYVKTNHGPNSLLVYGPCP